nr:immunoglobulin heavy chain junction region [Mus musculus]
CARDCYGSNYDGFAYW